MVFDVQRKLATKTYWYENNVNVRIFSFHLRFTELIYKPFNKEIQRSNIS